MQNKRKFDQQKWKHLQGQSLLEMALIIPILLVLIIGALEFGRLFFTKIVITNAAREGAYFLSIHPSDDDSGKDAAKAEAANSGIPDVTVDITHKTDSILVSVETQVPNILILGFLGNDFTITGTNYPEFPLSSSVEMMVQ